MGFRLTWIDNNLAEDGHRVYRSSSPMDPQNLPAPIADVGPDVLFYDDGDVTAGQTYYYRVGAYVGTVEKVSAELTAVASEMQNAGLQGAVEFDGVDNFFDFGNLLNLGGPGFNQLTVELRCTFYSLDGFQVLFEDGGQTRGFGIGLYQGNLVVAVNNSQQGHHQEIAYPTSKLAINTPYHFAATWEGPNGNLELFINGRSALRSTNLNPFIDFNGADNATIGAAAAPGDTGSSIKNDAVDPTINEGAFNGKMTELRIWGAIRTEGQIAAHRLLRVEGDEDNLLYYWPLNDGSGSTAVATTGGVNGTGYGTITWLPSEFT